MDKAYITWQAEGQALEISYSDAAMESMRQAAMSGLQKIPKRGLEIGGVLFGSCQGRRVQVDQWREIACEHSQGPGFTLSANDEEALRHLLDNAAQDPDLSQFRPVGWFRTRTRDGVHLSEEDIKLHNQFFPGPEMIILVIRPKMYEPAVAGFFFRDDSGEIHPGASLKEFELENTRRRLPLGFDPSLAPRRAGKPEDQPWASAPPSPPSTPSPSRPPRTVPPPPIPTYEDRYAPPGQVKVSVKKWSLALMILVLLAVLGIGLGWPSYDGQQLGQLGLQVREVGGQLMVQWNRNADCVVDSTGGELQIIDGAVERRVALSPAELQGGTLVYQRTTGDVELHLSVASQQAEPTTEIARFLGNDPSVESRAEGVSDDPLFQSIQADVKQISQDLEAEKKRTQQVRAAVETEKQKLGVGGPPGR